MKYETKVSLLFELSTRVNVSDSQDFPSCKKNQEKSFEAEEWVIMPYKFNKAGEKLIDLEKLNSDGLFKETCCVKMASSLILLIGSTA